MASDPLAPVDPYNGNNPAQMNPKHKGLLDATYGGAGGYQAGLGSAFAGDAMSYNKDYGYTNSFGGIDAAYEDMANKMAQKQAGQYGPTGIGGGPLANDQYSPGQFDTFEIKPFNAQTPGGPNAASDANFGDIFTSLYDSYKPVAHTLPPAAVVSNAIDSTASDLGYSGSEGGGGESGGWDGGGPGGGMGSESGESSGSEGGMGGDSGGSDGGGGGD